MNKIKVFVTIALLLWGSISFATEYHVSKSGNDSWDGSESSPWLTIAHGLASISGGDILTIHSGTYNEDDLQIRDSGTATNYTIIQGAEGETIVIDGGHTDNTSSTATIEINRDDSFNGLSYIKIKNLRITGGGGNETGNIRIGEDYVCDHIIIEDCYIYHMATDPSVNNPSLVVFKQTHDCIIKNCYLYGAGKDTGERTAIKIWSGTYNITVENNEIYDIGIKAIDNKHGNTSIGNHVYRNNYIHDVASYGVNLNSINSTIENNLFVHCGEVSGEHSTIIVYTDGGGPGGNGSIIRHNTIYKCGGGITLGENDSTGLQNITVKDNLIYDSYYSGQFSLISVSPYASPYTTGHKYDYNLYYDPDRSETDTIFRRFDNGDYTFSQWKTALGGCPNSDNDCNSVNLEPTFVGGDSPSTISDYGLTSSSNGKGVASDGTDMGADVSQVGVSWSHYSKHFYSGQANFR